MHKAFARKAQKDWCFILGVIHACALHLHPKTQLAPVNRCSTRHGLTVNPTQITCTQHIIGRARPRGTSEVECMPWRQVRGQGERQWKQLRKHAWGKKFSLGSGLGWRSGQKRRPYATHAAGHLVSVASKLLTLTLRGRSPNYQILGPPKAHLLGGDGAGPLCTGSLRSAASASAASATRCPLAPAAARQAGLGAE